MAAKATSSIQVIARMARLLDTMAAHPDPVSLKVLAHTTGLHPSTVFRILASLIEHDFVERSSAGHYRLGGKLIQLGRRSHDPLAWSHDNGPARDQQRDPAETTTQGAG